MDIRVWDERYRSGERERTEPTPLLAEIAGRITPGTALDLGCGTGRNAVWLARQGWRVTAIDGSRTAIEILRESAAARNLPIDARVADLEKHEFQIAPAAWQLITMCYYLQRDLFESAKLGLSPGGVLLAMVHMTEPGEPPTKHRVRPGELQTFFEGWEILHTYEGKPRDPAHQRLVAEIVVRRADSQYPR